MTEHKWETILPGLLTPPQLDLLADHLLQAVKHGHAEVTIKIIDSKPRFILITLSTPFPYTPADSPSLLKKSIK